MEIVNLRDQMVPTDTLVSSVTSAVMGGDKDRRASIERNSYCNASDISENDITKLDRFKLDQVIDF